MILVTGATGTIGSEVVRLLAAGSEDVRGMTRDPSKEAARPGVEFVRGDFGDPGSLAGAARGRRPSSCSVPPAPGFPSATRRCSPPRGWRARGKW
ncbi:SDR family oxidoreductase [Nonomuraea zeae]|uniref:SDR family oxidoreductase n=1 Tax=Nonomuraea zeae TaxID=1642303 RepID=UPI0036192F21